MKIIQMPPHINNSLERSVKQLKSNTNNNNTTTSTTTTTTTTANTNNLSFHHHHHHHQTSSILDISSLNTPTSSFLLTNSNSSETTLLSFNILVNEIEDLVSNNNNNNNILTDEDNEEEEEEEESESELDSDLSMDDNLFKTTNNQFDFDPYKNEIFDSNLFSQINTNEYTNSLSIYEPQQQQQSNQFIYPNNNYINTTNINQIQIKKEFLDDSSFSSNSDIYQQQQLQQQQQAITTTTTGQLVTVNNLNKTKIEKRYGPIVVRPRKNPAPTLRTGRKSKYIALTAEEEQKRELRRKRNRQAAEKCKLKRSEIEDKLEIDLKNLMSEQNNILLMKKELLEKKLYLENLLKQHNENCNNNNYTMYDYNNNSNSTNQSINYNYQMTNYELFSQNQRINQIQSNMSSFNSNSNSTPTTTTTTYQ
jgi:hypothetical protein